MLDKHLMTYEAWNWVKYTQNSHNDNVTAPRRGLQESGLN